MEGLTLASIRRNPSLIPLYAFVGAAAFGASCYMLRLAIRNPEVTWNSKKNPEPFQHYKNKQYKFYSPIRDYSKTKSLAPAFD